MSSCFMLPIGQPFQPSDYRQLQTRSHKLQQEEIVKTTEEVKNNVNDMLPIGQPFQPSDSNPATTDKHKYRKTKMQNVLKGS